MDKFDVIIVGAGLAGLGAAYTLAGSGLDVLVLERGDYPGAKNVTGGRLYVNPVRDLFPGLFERAPLERFITHEGISLMAKGRSVTFRYSGNELRAEPHQSFSILRSKFDRWLSERVEEQGVAVLPKVRVEGLIKDKGEIRGVMAGGDDLRADVVIVCDGALSLLSEKAGLRSPASPQSFALGVKEVITLDPGVINERFHLEGNEGAAHLYAGDVTQGKFGGGFLYTNKESLSLGVVIGIKDAMDPKLPVEVPALLEAFKGRPEISPLIRGGNTTEYSAHVIPEGGFKSLANLCGNGILAAGDAAGLALNIGFTVRGMEYALASGYFAAQAVLNAKEVGNFSSETLGVYRKLLEQSFVLQDLKNFQESLAVFGNPRLFAHYPEMIGNLLSEIYTIPAGPKDRLYPTLRRHLTLGELWNIFVDLRDVMKI